jgi:hypothetical protein
MRNAGDAEHSQEKRPGGDGDFFPEGRVYRIRISGKSPRVRGIGINTILLSSSIIPKMDKN